MKKKLGILFAGTGGQGIVTIGTIIGKALAEYEKFSVALTQNYGPEARGGDSICDLVVGREKIYFPKPRQIDIAVFLSPFSVKKYLDQVGENGFIIYDSTDIEPFKTDKKCYGISFLETARKDFSLEILMNMILIGAFIKITGLSKLESIKKIIEGRYEGKVLESNLMALEKGYALVDELGLEIPEVKV